MSKSKYYIAQFPSSSMKSPLATMSEHVLGKIDQIFEILRRQSSESCELLMILYNAIQNNESVFGLGIPDETSSARTSGEEKPSQKSTSPLKGVPISTSPTQKLPFVDRTNETLGTKNVETKSITLDSQISAELDEKLEKLSSPVESDKMNIATSKDFEMKTDTKEENKEIMESKEDINDLIRRDSAEVKFVSVIRHAGVIGVEVNIDIDSDCMSDGSVPKITEQKSSPSKKASSPGKSESKIKSLFGSPSKSNKLADSLSVPSESHLEVDYSNPNLQDFLAERLVSITKGKKTCMRQIDNYFKDSLRDAMSFCSTIENIKYVVENLPVAKEPYLSNDFLKLRENLLNIASDMSEMAELVLIGVKEDGNDLENCLNKMDVFEEDFVKPLSSKGTSNKTVTNIQKAESHLKEIFSKVAGTVILRDDRRAILLKSVSDFERLVNHFIKFLIIARILKPIPLASSQTGTDK